MRRLIVPLFILCVAGFTFSLASLLRGPRRVTEVPSGKPVSVIEPETASLGLNVPAFSLVDQDGGPVDQSIFDGKVTILDFFFTHCVMICPMMTLAMKDLSTELAGTDVRFVSMSVDTAHDTPARLKEYATEKEIDFSRWTFLTGEQQTVERIAMGALQFEVGPDKNPKNAIVMPGGETIANVIHPSKLVLVGPDRRVLGFYESNSLDDCRTLAIKARAVAKGLSK
jgi:protein SCO1/2